ncbi:hypothetical protein ABH931_002515 [Streptacidiphilus sp. MAP12-33]|uniref:hypothetical protein n=1 Tax=Streptacidiphilus sp. MAP12-33 TaxID=3156266 RepID=UPI0035113D40
MCHYCGCREIPLIKEFIAEHESVTALAGCVYAYGRMRDVSGAPKAATTAPRTPRA